MAMLNDVQQDLANLRVARDTAAGAARTLSFRAQAMRTRLATIQRTAPQGEEAAAIERQIAGVERESKAQRDRSRGVDRAMLERARGLLQVPIGDLVAQLDDHVPIVMFPVRLETKFGQGRDGAVELRVRIFPDDIQISTHDPALSEAERAAGDAYWVERSRALTLDADRRLAEQGAWSILATRFGGPRARYVARTTKPAGWPVPPAPGAAAAADPEPPRAALSGVPPRARLLPDFFVVTALDAGGNAIAQGTGKSIADTLQMGPDPEAPAASLGRDGAGRLSADDQLAWLIDYNRAVDAGMAVTLRLPGRVPIARVVAIGMRFSLSPESAAAALEELLSEHRFTRGIDILRQGSPTNNTDGAESSFTTDLSADEALVEQEVNGRVAVAVLDHATKGDAQRLAEALGISLDAINDWPNADAADMAQALAMNRALWPATVGTYLKEMVAARLPQATKSAIERFFLTYVTGRGLLPAIRVGTQPYGVLATSDLRAWVEGDDDDRDGAAFNTIVDGLRWFRSRFESREPFIAQAGRGTDPLAMTMRVIGQLASSVTLASRKAVTDELSWNTLRFQGTIPTIMLNWYQTLTDRKNTAFANLGLSRTGLPIGDLTFFPNADPLDVPVIDQDPAVPLSERTGIASFDGTRNYIDWLLAAPTADLRGELFKNADGTAIPAPRALLYRLLHHAWTASLVEVSRGVLTRVRPDFVTKEAAAFPAIVNVGPGKVLPDSYASDVSTASIGLTQNANALGDFVLDLARTGDAIALEGMPEALPLQTQREALARLAPLPTAVLERLFAEHIDLASYRLDAWQTGLVARRLDTMRRRARRDRGIYVGAYGYVENLEPKAPPTPIEQNTLPESLRSAQPVTEQAGNGGFVHTPSLSHAVTAAVLRNAYLTHAEPRLRDAMSVNLTSRRVRVAMSFIEGMRAGQELAALLGYQLERGLHERYPGIELDEFIYTLRARFPLVSRRLTPVPDGTAAEQIEARNVVDGYDLIEYVRGKTYPYAIAGLPATGSSQANAIVAEILLLEDALDAISDLLTAESVHQAVQSNMDRTRGALAAVTEGEMPPVPDVVQTPRSGRVFIERVALSLPPAALAWTNPATPRAAANPRLNRWLATQLPPPSTIGVEIRASAGVPATLTLDQTGLDAIDVVLMSGDRFGSGSSELERALADVWRDANGVDDNVLTLYATPAPGPDAPASFIVVDAGAGTAAVPLATLLPHLRALRHLVGSVRGLHAQDFQIPSELENAPSANPKGFALDGGGDLVDLPARIADARDALDTANTALQTVVAGLEASYKAVIADATTFNAAAWTAPLAALRLSLRAIALHGSPEALPRSASGVNAGAGIALYEQAVAVHTAIAKRIDLATEALAPLPAEAPLPAPKEEARRQAGRLDRRLANLLDAGRQALGTGFPLQPVFRVATAARAEIEASLASPAESHPLAIEAWLQSLARVRTRIADLALCCAAAQWTTGAEPRLVPVQLPHRPTDPWIGAEWTAAPPAGDIISVMTVDAPALFGGDLEGLFLDDWTETVPTTRETTGIAFNFDRPNAAAPQALLIATPPAADGRWQWQELLGTVNDTFDRARLRALEPDDLQASPLFQLLPMTLMAFTELYGLTTTLLNRHVLEDAALTR